MSKDKRNTSDSAATPKTQQSTATQKTKKKKIWKHSPKKPVQKKSKEMLLPPRNAQQFSANWKMLFEVLKPNSPSVKSQALDSKKTPQVETVHDNSKKAETHKKLAKDFSKKTAKPSPSKGVKAGKEKAVPSSSQLNGSGKDPAPSKTQPRPKATKRKQDHDKATSCSEHKAKKQKSEEVSEKKTTEEDLWFDDVDPDDIEATVGSEDANIMRKKQGIKVTSPQDTEKALVKEGASEVLTKAVAMDCEMVGVGPDGDDSIVARVSLVNRYGTCIYDKYVKPTEKVTDYRTAVSGIRPNDIVNGENVTTVQKEVAQILQGRILVGHAIHNDLKILLLDHPKKNIRDTQKYKPFKEIAKSSRPALRVLCKEVLHVKVQHGEHSSVQDAQATMRLYTLARKEWEAEIKAKRDNPYPTKSPRKLKAPQAQSTAHETG